MECFLARLRGIFYWFWNTLCGCVCVFMFVDGRYSTKTWLGSTRDQICFCSTCKVSILLDLGLLSLVKLIKSIGICTTCIPKFGEGSFFRRPGNSEILCMIYYANPLSCNCSVIMTSLVLPHLLIRKGFCQCDTRSSNEAKTDATTQFIIINWICGLI